MVVGETGQGREGRYSLTSTHHCSQIFTHRNSIASIPNSHLAFCGVSQQSVGGAEWGAEGSEGGHQGWRREGGEGILWKERDSATVCRRKGARVKRAWENAGRRRRGFDWNKGIWRSKNTKQVQWAWIRIFPEGKVIIRVPWGGGRLSESGLNSFECLHKDQNMESLSPSPRVLLTPAPVSACRKIHLKKPGLSAQSTKESYSSKSKDIVLTCYSGKSEKSPIGIELILTKVQYIHTTNTGAH